MEKQRFLRISGRPGSKYWIHLISTIVKTDYYSSIRYKFNYVAFGKETAVPSREFSQLQQDLENTLRDFEVSLDFEERVELLRRLRRLLDEADHIPSGEYLN